MSVWGSGFVPHSVSEAHSSWHIWGFNLLILHCCLIFHHGNALQRLLLRMGTWLAFSLEVIMNRAMSQHAPVHLPSGACTQHGIAVYRVNEL